MSGLDAIAVRVESLAPAESVTTGQAQALLAEIREHLEALVDSGRTASIDLRSLPMTPGDLDELSAVLGTGAIDASVNALGRSEVRETRYAGVWWVRHFNEADEPMLELIEICRVPALLLAPIEDIAASLRAFGSPGTADEVQG